MRYTNPRTHSLTVLTEDSREEDRRTEPSLAATAVDDGAPGSGRRRELDRVRLTAVSAAAAAAAAAALRRRDSDCRPQWAQQQTPLMTFL